MSLLDGAGRLYVGSVDNYLYALNSTTVGMVSKLTHRLTHQLLKGARFPKRNLTK